MKNKHTIVSISLNIYICLFFVLGSNAFASPLLFDPKNSAFFSGANSSSTTTLMSSVVRPANPNSTTASGISSANLIEQGLISQISTKITNDIFSTSNDSGNYDLGNGNTISFVRDITNATVVITIVNSKTGTTVVTLPSGI